MFNKQSTTTTLSAGSPSAGSSPNIFHSGNKFSFISVSRAEVYSKLISLNPNKAVGEYNLDPSLLHLSADLIAAPLVHIFNLTFASGKIQKIWKSVQVIPLHKGGDPCNFNNYHPVSKLSCLAKSLESLVHSQQRLFLESTNTLQPEQSGFR